MENVARLCSAQGGFSLCSGRSFGAELDQGSMTRPSALAMVGGRCKMVNNMDEMASSLAQRSSCPLPLLSEEVRACSEVEDLLLLAWSLASRRLQGELV